MLGAPPLMGGVGEGELKESTFGGTPPPLVAAAGFAPSHRLWELANRSRLYHGWVPGCSLGRVLTGRSAGATGFEAVVAQTLLSVRHPRGSAS